MTKYSRTEKLAAAKAVEAGDSAANVARRFGISRQVVHQSVRLYQEHEDSAIFEKKRSDTAAQKLDLLKYMHSRDLPQEETARKFGIRGSATIWEWERYLENGMEGLTPRKNRQAADSAQAESPADAVCASAGGE